MKQPLDSVENPSSRTGAAQRVVELLERLSLCALRAGSEQGLNSAQWTALRYFSRANRFSRTVSAFASYHGTTRGTASKTIQSLVGKGLIQRQEGGADRRSHTLELTLPGQEILRLGPVTALAAAVAKLDCVERQGLADHLSTLADQVLSRRGQPEFGACTSCEHLLHTPSQGTEYGCRARGAQLDCEELDCICVHFTPEARRLAGAKIEPQEPRT